MMTSKQRSTLRGMANGLSPICMIGKGGISKNLLDSIAEALESHELVKISVLQSCEFGAKEMINDLAARLSAEPIAAIGSKIVLYRRSSRKDFEHIEF